MDHCVGIMVHCDECDRQHTSIFIMLKRIREFWAKSYRSDPVAFRFELVSFIFTVGASLTLAITANNPDLRIVYPGFFVGAITQCYAAYRRNTAWVMMITFYFGFVNVFGFGRAMGWW